MRDLNIRFSRWVKHPRLPLKIEEFCRTIEL
jgi:hypothetical protein